MFPPFNNCRPWFIIFACLLRAHETTASDSSSNQLRGDAMTTQQENINNSTSAIDNSLTCRIYTMDTMTVDDERSTTSTEEEVRCIPINQDGIESDYDYSIDLPTEIRDSESDKIAMGQLFVTISDTTLDGYNIVIDSNATYNVAEFHDQRYRHLQEKYLKTTGTMTVAVVTISASDSPMSESVQSINQKIWGSGTGFPAQYEDCSFSKLRFVKSAYGVGNVQLRQKISEFNAPIDVVRAAQEQLTRDINLEASQIADKVIFCVPKGTGDWAGSAGVNHWRAQMNHDWCTSLSGVAHEMGHMIGLLHAQENFVVYADRTGYMGSGYRHSSWPNKCFNGHNNNYLGWYDDKKITLSTSDVSTAGKLIDLATFVDFDKAMQEEKVLINVNDEYFLQYNVAKSFNQDTEQKKNQVVLTQSVSSGTNSLAGLDSGDSYRISQENIVIEVCGSKAGFAGANVMQVSLTKGNAASMCPLPNNSVTSSNKITVTSTLITSSATNTPATTKPSASSSSSSSSAANSDGNCNWFEKIMGFFNLLSC